MATYLKSAIKPKNARKKWQNKISTFKKLNCFLAKKNNLLKKQYFNVPLATIQYF